MALKALDFRQHYIFARPLLHGERHWLLDWGPSRAVLKAILRKRMPHAGVPVFGQGSKYDFELDLLIDALGLRKLSEPSNATLRCRLDYLFLKLLLRVEFQGNAAVNPMGGIPPDR